MKLRVWLLITTITAGLVVLATVSIFNYFFEKWTTQEVVAQFAVTYMLNGGREACEESPSTWSAEARPDRPDRPKDETGNHGEPPDNNRDHKFAGTERLPFHRQLFAYDITLKSTNPEAPEIDKDFKNAINSSKGTTLRSVTGRSLRPHRPPHHPGHPPPDGGPPPLQEYEVIPGGPHDDDQRKVAIQEIMVRMPWRTGPCANVLVRFDESHPGSIGRPPHGRLANRLPDFLQIPFLNRFSPPVDIWSIPVIFMLITVLIAVGPIVRRIRQLTRQVRSSVSDQYQTPITVTGKGEIGELARAFEEARSEIRSQIATQEMRELNLRNFVENTTHDISIPLTVLQGRLSQMAKQTEGVDPELVKATMNEANYLASLIYNLSVASKLETGQPAMLQEPVNLNEVILRCASRHRPIARQRQVLLDHAVPETPLMTTGDVTFIEQAVSNVIFNAIRHNHSDGHVAVILESTGENTFRISVIDDGPGIPEDQMSRLVERYFRCDKERGRGADGQGLGLNIAFQLADMHGWKFELSRSEFGGLRVDFTGSTLLSVQLSANE